MYEFEEKINELVYAFNRKVMENSDIQSSIKLMKRRLLIVTDKNSYYSSLNDSKLENFAIGTIQDPDIKISADEDTFYALFNREMGPMKAIVTKKLKIDASLEDILLLKKFINI